MNIKTILEFIIGLSIGELPVFVQPIAWVATLAASVLFFVMIVKVLLSPLTAWLR